MGEDHPLKRKCNENKTTNELQFYSSIHSKTEEPIKRRTNISFPTTHRHTVEDCSSHLNDADGLARQMVGRVEEEGEQQDGTAIPADKPSMNICVSDLFFYCFQNKSFKTRSKQQEIKKKSAKFTTYNCITLIKIYKAAFKTFKHAKGTFIGSYV